MLSQSETDWILNRLNIATDLPFEELAKLPVEIQSNMFFTYDGIEDKELLTGFRKISDRYCLGEISRDEARHLLRQYATAHGKDDGSKGLRNLASTARLNLILDQNAKMARAVGRYETMHRPANLKMFPYVIYRASVGSSLPRESHQKYDGMIIDKRDPWLKVFWPPNDIDCNCDLSNCSAKKAATLGSIKPMSKPEDVKIESDSGFAFDPAAALIQTPDGFRAYTTAELREIFQAYH